jgi:hypothetical protein
MLPSKVTKDNMPRARRLGGHLTAIASSAKRNKEWQQLAETSRRRTLPIAPHHVNPISCAAQSSKTAPAWRHVPPFHCDEAMPGQQLVQRIAHKNIQLNQILIFYQ